MLLNDRRHAGILLARQLESYRAHPHAIVLALPRGGVVVGLELSLELHLPLDLFITRKIGLPESPEYAVGALSETGSVYLNPDAAAYLDSSGEDLPALIDAQRHEIARRQLLYRHGRTLPSLHGRVVILVDDGLATGSTFFASIDALKKMSPLRVVAAVPVSPRSTADKLRAMVDECVILECPEPFTAVGACYADFDQVEDEEVLRCLQHADRAYRERPRALGADPAAPTSVHHYTET
jgi:putative phosphoribosyl transferase